MPTTRQIQPHVRVMLGMDGTTPPHLLDDTKWSMCRGLRSYQGRLVQFPMLFSILAPGTNTRKSEGLTNIPVDTLNKYHLIGFSTPVSGSGPGGDVVQFREDTTSQRVLTRPDGTAVVLNNDPGDVQGKYSFDRMAGALYNRILWFTNPLTKIRYTEGSYVGEYDDQIQGNITSVIPDNSTRSIAITRIQIAAGASRAVITTVSPHGIVAQSFNIQDPSGTVPSRSYTSAIVLTPTTFSIPVTQRQTTVTYHLYQWGALPGGGFTFYSHTTLRAIAPGPGNPFRVDFAIHPQYSQRFYIETFIDDNTVKLQPADFPITLDVPTIFVEDATFTVTQSVAVDVSPIGATVSYAVSGDPTATISTFTSTKPTKALIGQHVFLSGFYYYNFNGDFIVIDTPTAYSFTFKPTPTVAVLNDPNTGQMQSQSVKFEIPSARYLIEYFDHLVVANYTYEGNTSYFGVRWSDLYKPDTWRPTPENEADFYDVASWVSRESLLNGITGMEKMRDLVVIYTDSSLIGMRYVGLPKVMQIFPLKEGWGSGLYYGVVAGPKGHYFYDDKNQDFFFFDGMSDPQSIGDPIIAFFLTYCIDNPAGNFQKTFGFHMPERSEIWWTFFVAQTSNLPFIGDVSIVYNYDTDSWSVYYNARINGVGFSVPRAKTIDELAGTCDALSGSCNNLGNAGAVSGNRIYADLGSGGLLRDITSVDTFSTVAFNESPFVETKDFTTDLQRVEEVDRICLHADYQNSDGIDVFVSARDSIQDTVIYRRVGRWTKQTRDGIVSFPAISGRIFRYKFVFLPDTVTPFQPRGCVLYDFTDNVFNITAEQ